MARVLSAFPAHGRARPRPLSLPTPTLSQYLFHLDMEGCQTPCTTDTPSCTTSNVFSSESFHHTPHSLLLRLPRHCSQESYWVDDTFGLWSWCHRSWTAM